MRIHAHMDLGLLIEALGAKFATEDDARIVRDYLVAHHEGKRISDFTEQQWLAAIDAAFTPPTAGA